MNWVPTDHEVSAVRLLAASRRYHYLVKHAVDQGRLWSLRSEAGWVVAIDQLGRELHPVWPHPKFADWAAVDQWAGSRPAPIEIHEWLGVWTPGIRESGRLVAVFPSDRSDEVAIDPDQFAADILEELGKVDIDDARVSGSAEEQG